MSYVWIARIIPKNTVVIGEVSSESEESKNARQVNRLPLLLGTATTFSCESVEFCTPLVILAGKGETGSLLLMSVVDPCVRIAQFTTPAAGILDEQFSCKTVSSGC